MPTPREKEKAPPPRPLLMFKFQQAYPGVVRLSRPMAIGVPGIIAAAERPKRSEVSDRVLE
jgi:hypothetical protein